jgi:hypothetical protein
MPHIANLVRNPSFEATANFADPATARWNTDGNVQIDTLFAHEGEQSALLAPSAAEDAILSQMIKIPFGADFISVYFNVRGGTALQAFDLTAELLYFDADGVLLRTDTLAEIDQDNLGFGVAGEAGFTTYSIVTQEKPVGTVQARLRFVAEAAADVLELNAPRIDSVYANSEQI